MSTYLDAAISKIEAQQQGKEGSAPWMVGEQLKDLLRAEPRLAELVAGDLEQDSLSLRECEKKIKAYADAHKTGNFACVPPAEAERIIRTFYGLPVRGEAPPKAEEDSIIDLTDYL